MWSKKTKFCLSCGTTEWEHKAKGYCTKCYPFILRIEKVDHWDDSNPTSLIAIDGFSAQDIQFCINQGKFKKAKHEILNQLKRRLAIIKDCVNPENVDGLAMEQLLDEFAELILKDTGKNMFHSHAALYDRDLNSEQLSIIYKDLNSILMRRRFTLNLGKIYFG